MPINFNLALGLRTLARSQIFSELIFGTKTSPFCIIEKQLITNLTESSNDKKNLVIDVRYSMIPNQTVPMWGLVIDVKRGMKEHAIWWTSRGLEQSQLSLFKDMLNGKNCINNQG